MIYKNFLGIDVAKNKIDIFSTTNGSKNITTVANSEKDISEFINNNKELVLNSYVVIDHTGGYEKLAKKMFFSKAKAVHIANGRCVKSFIRSFGTQYKTDKIDAIMLAKYGEDRHKKLRIEEAENKKLIKLKELVERQNDLSEMITKEKNRKKSPNGIIKSCERILMALKQELFFIEKEIVKVINAVPELQEKFKKCQEIKGVGEKTAFKLLALLPELGKVNRREIASLSGVAPYAYESGNYEGRRRVRGGRKGVKEALFIAILTAIRYNDYFKKFYEKLVKQGKAKMLAITACMRKLIILINNKLKYV